MEFQAPSVFARTGPIHEARIRTAKNQGPRNPGTSPDLEPARVEDRNFQILDLWIGRRLIFCLLTKASTAASIRSSPALPYRQYSSAEKKARTQRAAEV